MKGDHLTLGRSEWRLEVTCGVHNEFLLMNFGYELSYIFALENTGQGWEPGLVK